MSNKDNDKNILELEELASTVFNLKNESIPRRPIVIEFCGSPKSGKTSCINSLDLFLRRNNFRTRVLRERASICPVEDKYDPYFNIWTVTSAIAELSEILSNHSKYYDVVILDRGLFDALCWFSWLQKKQHFDEYEFTSVESFLTMNRWRSVIDLVYVFTAEPKVSMQREFANLLTRKQGSIMRNPVLTTYKQTLIDMMSKYKDTFGTIEHIDTSEIDQNQVNYNVTKSILDVLNNNISEKVGFINRSQIKASLPEQFNFSELSCCTDKLQFDARCNVEKSSDKVQPIPILIITNIERTKVFVVKKSKKRTSEESPESNKILLYLGGHIRQEDLSYSGENDLLWVSRYALHREIKEEIGIDYYANPKDEPFCIWVKDNDRSEKHLAICYIKEVDFNTLKYKLDKNEFVFSGSTKSGTPQDIATVYKDYDKLESWSQIILQKVFGYKSKQNAIQLEVFNP
ncbi:hypothetical protein [Methylobacter sp.]|uniref:hypothetical protein n=1 Tax=Methylobacter sp. TaxID=2051955 RepID=UPI001212BA27|nr:hypothetical protein [Methylobacter sp.]TAK64168.1 MAG: hypothetical protein EPO18_04380 [Methylobacter sp.]